MHSLTVTAAVCRGFGDPLTVEELLLRRPLAAEVLVRVAACSICHSDIAYADGAWGGELPAVYGHEAAGTVVEVGPGCGTIAPGDRVVVTLVRSCGRCRRCTRGAPTRCEAVPALEPPLRDAFGDTVVQGLRVAAFADHVLVHASQLVPVPDDVSLDVASLLGCGVLTGVGSVLRTAGVEAGDSVAVIGAGGVGLNCVQGAVLAGAGEIVAVDPVAGKRAAALALGATDALDPSKVDVDDRLFDYVFVAVGAKQALQVGLRLLGRGGKAVVVGMPPTGVTLELDATALADSGQQILGSKLGSSVPREDIPWLLERYREGRLQLDELISGRFALRDVNDALEASRGGEALRNVLRLDSASATDRVVGAVEPLS